MHSLLDDDAILELALADPPEPTKPAPDDDWGTDEPAQVPEPWRCDTLEKAVRLCRAYANEARQIEEISDVAKSETARIKAWADRESAPHEHTLERLATHLEYYTRTQQRSGGKKTITLPAGVRCGLKASTPEVERDDDKVLSWVEKLPEGMRKAFLKVEYRWGELKKALDFKDGGAVFKETGEVVDGITTKPPADPLAFSISVKDEAVCEDLA